jgi:hypothetical protein
MKRRGTCVGVAVVALLALGLLAPVASADGLRSHAELSLIIAADDPAEQSPFGGQPVPPLTKPASEDTRLGSVSAAEAIEIATDDPTIGAEIAESNGTKVIALIRGLRWQVEYRKGGELVAYAIVDGDGNIDEAWRDFQVSTPLARGYEDAIAQKVNAPYVWLPLCLLFLAPFFDPRRPWRLVHLDLLVLLGLGISLFFFNRAEITASVGLTYPVLGYFLLRGLVAGFRPREEAGPLIPLAPVRWLAVGVFVLVAARAALNIFDSHVIDIGVAGVIGGDRIGHGQPLYEGGFSPGLDLRGDVYGPVNYLVYLPFTAIFGWDGVWGNGDPAAAHAAAIAFDLACIIGLVVLGRRLRAGNEGRALGWALAFAWVACPWTLYVMNANANDALIAALSIAVLIALRSPGTRGVLVGLAAAAKFGPAALAPLFSTADTERRWRGAVIFSAAFALVCVATFAPFIPDGGLRELYDRTLGYQATRSSPFSVWGQAPSLDWLQSVARLAAGALAVAVAFWPRRKTALQVAGLAAAVTIAVQLTAGHWFYFYVVWFLPFVLVLSFASQRQIAARNENGRP